MLQRRTEQKNTLLLQLESFSFVYSFLLLNDFESLTLSEREGVALQKEVAFFWAFSRFSLNTKEL